MSLHVERHGAGPDLVLLHGWGLHGGVWDELVPMISSDWRVHVVDLPGHGRSAGHATGSFDAAVDAVAAVIPERSVVCGWSLGGLLAQRLAVRHPRHVSQAVLVSTTPCFVERDGWAHAMKPAALEAFAHGLRDERHATLRRFVQLNALNGVHGREAVRAFTGRLAAHGEPSGAALEASLAWLRETDLRAEAAHIACPAIVVHGARDALAPVEAGRWLARTLPRAQALELEDAAHLPFFTHRAAFAAALRALHG